MTATAHRHAPENRWPEIQRRVLEHDDDTALALLGEHYTAYFVKVAFAACGDEQMAQDSVQEVFRKCLEKHILAQYDPERATFKTWFYRIVVNEALARTRSRPSTSIDEDPQVLERLRRQLAPPPTQGEAEFADSFLYLRACRPFLGDNEGAALVLYAAGQADASIASMLKVSEATVRGYRFSWRRKLGGFRKVIDGAPAHYRQMALRVATVLLRKRHVDLTQTRTLKRKLQALMRKVDALQPCSGIVRQWLSGHHPDTISRTNGVPRAHVHQCIAKAQNQHPELDDLVD